MTAYNALADCRSIVNRQIEFLEHELGIEPAFPITLVLLKASQVMTARMQAEQAEPCR